MGEALKRSQIQIFRVIAAVCAMLAGLALTTVAQAATADAFLAAGMEVPSRLQAQGYTRFGDLDLATFTAQMQQVRVIFSADLTVAKRNQNGRISARWETTKQGKTIRVYTPSWNRWVEQQTLLALHEYLGILGFADDNYWLSTQLWTLSMPESRSLSAQERSTIERSIEVRTRIRYAGGGGVVGVGGGGEGGTLWVRQRRIRKNMSEIEQGTGNRDEAIGGIYQELEGNAEVSYNGFESPEMKRKIKKYMDQQKPYCMVSAGLCKLKPKKRIHNECTCDGSSEPGTIIYTAKPW